MREARLWVFSIATVGVVFIVGCEGDAGVHVAGVGGTAGTFESNSAVAPGGGGIAGAATDAAGLAAPLPVGAGLGGSDGAPAAGTGPAAGAGGMPPVAGSSAMAMNPAICPAAPADAPAKTIAALAAVNNYRVPAGAGCATMIPQINASAAAHCAYYAMHMPDDMCVANPHLEVMGCTGFTGATPGDRMQAAGYMTSGGGEVMAFVNDAQGSVDTWVNSVWHRIPILDPWITHFGYGSSARCDTIDFSRGTPAPPDTIVVYPYDGETNVPLAFNGANEGPTPPAPSTGWPSSAPISVYAQKIAVTEHVLTKAGDATPIEHIWLDSNADVIAPDVRKSLTNVALMYANLPFEPNTVYRVKIAGTYTGGALTKEWTFTTSAAPVRGGQPRP